ncbi:MFS transporter [Bacillus thuringiensis serovar pingluonsis]|uniref:MFS transporter n=1 Tax=Bacillus thuringiensis serovar pingluonsis TaxID=180881 RepID=A0A243B9A7_BACTU|nr:MULTISPECIES: MFS transporter [Bacillus cereus group]MEB9686461.1 MFS transporter [Bacillus anthracis]OTY41673.1 MFS transporter [Bacillus thuringiensis serovar pingluonsis]
MSSTNLNNKTDNYKWIILFIATVAQTCATFVTYGIGPLATFYSKEYDLSQFETGLMVSAVNIGPIFSMLIFGNFMDKHGERWIVGIGSILLGISMLIAYPITEYFYLLFVLALVGIWYGTAQPGGSSAIVHWFPNKHRGLAMGIRQTGIPLGGALASAVLPFFFYHYGLSSAILVQAVVAIMGGVIFLIFYRDHGMNINKTESYSFIEKLNKIKNNVNLYPVFFIGITMMSLQLVILAHLMSYLTNTLDLSLKISGGLLSLTLFGGMFGRIILAWISDRLFNGNRSKPLQLTILLTAITVMILIYLLPFLPMWGISILCFSLGFLGLGWYSLFIVLMSERSDPNFIGLTVSFGLTLNQIFIVLAPSLFGLLVDYFKSYKIPFLLLTVLICIGGMWLALTNRSHSHEILKSKEISK